MHTTNGLVTRPTFHFTPRRNWMNDPNGLVYHRGLWHLYFQYNPEGSDWGNMSWGHATSADLQHWTEHPVALPYREGEQIYSGSIVVSGPDDDAPLAAFYTSAYSDGHQAQSKAVSSDGGFTWQINPDNPVLDRGTHNFRDPKVVRYLDKNGDVRWVLLAVEAEERRVLFYSSDDLRSWEYLSDFGPFGDEGVVWECPDLIPLAVDGRSEDVRWVLLLSTNPVGDDGDPHGSSMSYVVGHFDGRAFTAGPQGLRRLDHGRDFYAGVTFDSAPRGEAVMLGWMSNWRYAAQIPSSPWRGAMSLPRCLGLRQIGGVPSLVQEPPAFVAAYLTRAVPTTLFGTAQPVDLTLSDHAILELRWDVASTGVLRLRLHGGDGEVEVGHAPSSNTLRVTRGGPACEAVHPDFPATITVPVAGVERGRLLLSLDGPLLEIFVNDGEATVSNLVMLGTGTVTASLSTERGGPVTAIWMDVPDQDGTH